MATPEPRLYAVNRIDREPLLRWLENAIRSCGGTVIYSSDADHAPFRITFETPIGERMGIIVYAFLANSKLTKNRPSDEHRFQIKYGAKTAEEHRVWQDPYGLYTTLFVGIDPELNHFVGADPILHSPTKFFISFEYKQAEVDHINGTGWHVWERDRRQGQDGPVETVVGGGPESFLRYIRLERGALGEDQGHRYQLASKGDFPLAGLDVPPASQSVPAETHLHALAREFQLPPDQILELIGQRRRLKTAVRGGVAEIHLLKALGEIEGVTELESLDNDAGGDVRLRYLGSRPLLVECKNVRGVRTSGGLAQIDFQRTRASKTNPCSRYYAPADFDVVAACLHAVTERWEFSYALTRELDPHAKCPGKLASNVRVDSTRWREDVTEILRKAAED